MLAEPGRPDGPEPGHGAGRAAVILEQAGVRLLGAKPDTIDSAEDRQALQGHHGEASGEPVHPFQGGGERWRTRWTFAGEIGYPVIVRPAFTMGGTGGGICRDRGGAARDRRQRPAAFRPIHQVLIEKCISGWKEIEFEVMRDGKGNVITVCNMENFDPVGVHTGDSIVVAPRPDAVRQGIPDAAHRGAQHHHRAWRRGRLQLSSLP